VALLGFAAAAKEEKSIFAVEVHTAQHGTVVGKVSGRNCHI